MEQLQVKHQPLWMNIYQGGALSSNNSEDFTIYYCGRHLLVIINPIATSLLICYS